MGKQKFKKHTHTTVAHNHAGHAVDSPVAVVVDVVEIPNSGPRWDAREKKHGPHGADISFVNPHRSDTGSDDVAIAFLLSKTYIR